MKKIFHNKISSLLFSITMVGALFSCQTELLDPTPETSYPTDAVFNTPQRVEQQVNGLYDAVKDGNFLGSRFLIYSDIRGEEFMNRLTNGVTGLQTWNHTLVESMQSTFSLKEWKQTLRSLFLLPSRKLLRPQRHLVT
jgi:starch-binding outer membrane protein, SusD/RagB family